MSDEPKTAKASPQAKLSRAQQWLNVQRANAALSMAARAKAEAPARALANAKKLAAEAKQKPAALLRPMQSRVPAPLGQSPTIQRAIPGPVRGNPVPPTISKPAPAPTLQPGTLHGPKPLDTALHPQHPAPPLPAGPSQEGAKK